MERWWLCFKKRSFNLLFLGFVSLSIGIGMIITKEPILAVVSFGGGFLCLIFSSLSDYEYFEGLGIKAKLKSEVNEAKDLLEKLQKVNSASVIMFNLMLKQVSISGRFDSYFSALERTEIRRQCVLALEGLDLKEEVIGKSLQFFDEKLENDIVRAMRLVSENEYLKLEKDGAGSIITSAREERNQHVIDLNNNPQWTQEEKIERAKEQVRKSKIFSDEQRIKILQSIDGLNEDLEYYRENHESRRPDVWEQLEI